MALISEIQLTKYCWQTDNKVFVVGFTWLKAEYLSGQNFINSINANLKNYDIFQHFISKLNGQFSIVVQQEEEVWLACSHTWSYPIFYKKSKSKYIISDEPENLIKTVSDKKADPFSALYFLNFGVTPKETTLSKSVSQLRPGETACLTNTGKAISHVNDYFDYSNNNFPEKVSAKDLQNHLIKSFEKYYDQIKGSQVLLPLTKGYDSRLLACLLAEFGHKDVNDYFDFSNNNFPEKVSAKDLQNHLIKSFEKYYEQIKGSQVLLPLTKGYDSRLLACLLAEFGHKDVICATWGRRDNLEKQTAHKVAEKLGFKYYSIDYTDAMIRNFTKTENFNNYVKFVGHWSSMPFFYEYFGLTHLLNNGIIDKEVVAMPGHPGDFLKGSHLNQSMLDFSADDFAAHVIKHFGTTTPIMRNRQKELHNYLVKNYFSEQKESLIQSFERWDLEERQCKFIGNSSMIFSFLGINYLMPLFDLSILQLFRKTPLNQRIGEVLYNKTLENNFFKKYHVDFDLKSGSQVSAASSKVKDLLIGLIPHSLKIHYYPVDDDIFYREITRELRNANKSFEFKHPLRPHFYNSYIAQWYLQYIANKPF